MAKLYQDTSISLESILDFSTVPEPMKSCFLVVDKYISTSSVSYSYGHTSNKIYICYNIKV